MRNADILIKISPIIETFNIKQKMIVNQLLSNSDYSFVEFMGEMCIKDKNGDIFNFVKYVKAKCNCN
jgi:hypothetical protein